MIEIREVNETRYITPLRDGGSLPALAETDDEFKYVIKFCGAGHGSKALIAELIGGLTAKVLGLQILEHEIWLIDHGSMLYFHHVMCISNSC